MKIALCLKEDPPETRLDERFGRAAWFAVTDTGNRRDTVFLENPARNESSGAGSRAVQLLLDLGAEAVIAPEFGPTAFEALKSFGLKLYRQGDHRDMDSALKAWEEGLLEEIRKPSAEGLHRA